MNFDALWGLIRADLSRARVQLPSVAAVDQHVRDYHEYLDHNELELAWDALRAYAEEQPVNSAFWLFLAAAAETMNLSEKAHDCRRRAEAG